MKQLKRIVGIALTIAMLVTSVPALAFADDPILITGTSVMNALAKETMENTWFYSDAWFAEDADKLDSVTRSHIAVLSAIAAGTSIANKESSTANISDMLSAMGFSKIESNQYSYKNVKLDLSVGVIIGQKKINTENGSFTLLAVIPRSAGYETEWISDLLLGESGLHEGFKSARDEVLRFMKEYITYNTGSETEFKVWIPGYSRGAGVANLVAGFLSDDPGYFGDKASFGPETVFGFTFGTPGTVGGDTKKGEALSVGANRASYTLDTEGDAYTYSGSDADVQIDPENDRYSNIINYVSDSDYIAMLPPRSWDFCRFGTTISLQFGDELMITRLEDIDLSLSNAYINGRYSTTIPWKSFDLASLYIIDDWDISGGITTRDLLISRIENIETLIADRKDYVNGYQDVLSAALAVFGTDIQSLVNGVNNSEHGTGDLVLAGILLYMAYAVDCAKQDSNMTDIEAVVDVIEGFVRYFSGTNVELSGTGAEKGFMMLLANTMNNKQCMTAFRDLLYGLQGKDYFERLLTSLGLDPDGEYALVRLLEDIADSCSTDSPVYSVDDLFKLTCQKIDEHYTNDPEFAELLTALAAMIPQDTMSTLTEAVKQYMAPGSEPTPELTVMTIVRACVSGFKITDPDTGDEEVIAPANIARIMVIGLTTSMVAPQIGLNIGDYEIVSGIITSNYEGDGKFEDFIEEVIKMLFNISPDDPLPSVSDLFDRYFGILADDALSGVTRDDIRDMVGVIKAEPSVLRKAATALLFSPRDRYDLGADIRDFATEYSTFGLIKIAHFIEQYITCLEGYDTDNYSIIEADVLSPVYDADLNIISYTSKHYTDLQSAIDAVPEDGIVKLMGTIAVPVLESGAVFTIKEKPYFTFDFNGKIMLLLGLSAVSSIDITGIAVEDSVVHFTDSSIAGGSDLAVFNGVGGSANGISIGKDSVVEIDTTSIDVATDDKYGESNAINITGESALYLSGGSYNGNIKKFAGFDESYSFISITGGVYSLSAAELMMLDPDLDPASGFNTYEIVPNTDYYSELYPNKVIMSYVPIGSQIPVIRDEAGNIVTNKTVLTPGDTLYADGVSGTNVSYLWDYRYRIPNSGSVYDEDCWLGNEYVVQDSDIGYHIVVTAVQMADENGYISNEADYIYGSYSYTPSVPSYEVTDGEKYYLDFRDALNNAEDTATLRLVGFVSDTTGASYVIPEGKFYSLDLNGYDIDVGETDTAQDVTAIIVSSGAGLRVYNSDGDWDSWISAYADTDHETTAVYTEGYFYMPEDPDYYGGKVLCADYALKMAGTGSRAFISEGYYIGWLDRTAETSADQYLLSGGNFYYNDDNIIPGSPAASMTEKQLLETYVWPNLLTFDPRLEHGADDHAYEMFYGVDEDDDECIIVKICFRELNKSVAPVLKKDDAAITKDTVINPGDYITADFPFEDGSPVLFKWIIGGVPYGWDEYTRSLSSAYLVSDADVGKQIQAQPVQYTDKDGNQLYSDDYVFGTESALTPVVTAKESGGGGSEDPDPEPPTPGPEPPAPAPGYSLTVSKGSGSGSYKEGDQVSLTAEAAQTGQIFDKWSFDPALADTDIVSGDLTSKTITIKMPAHALSAAASYKADPSYNPGGGGSSGGGGGGSSGGGGGSSSGGASGTAATTNADGSTTQTKTNTDGTKTETTTAKNGTSVSKTTDKNGNTTAISVAVSQTAVNDSEKNNMPAEIPGTVPKDTNISVSVPSGKSVDMAIPVANAGPSTVLYKVNADGTRELINDCITEDGKVIATVDSSCTLVAADNRKFFTDVDRNRWSDEYIDFVTAREIFKGNGDGTFGLLETVSKGMIAQVLYNIDKDAKPGDASKYTDSDQLLWFSDSFGWATEENIVTGNPDGSSGGMLPINKEASVTMFFRYAQKKGLDSGKRASLSPFKDAATVRSYSREALEWAVAEGIINGDNGNINPEGLTDREQLSAITTRFIKFMQKNKK